MLDAEVKQNKAEAVFNFSVIQAKPPIDEGLFRYYRDQGYDIPREEFEFFLDDYDRKIEGEIKKKPKYFYTAKALGCKEVASETIEVSKTIRVTYLDAFGNPQKNIMVKLKEIDGKEHSKKTNEDGYVEYADMIPTENFVHIEEAKEMS